MPELTIWISDELQRGMQSHPEIDWNEVLSNAVQARLRVLDDRETHLSRSKLTERDAVELGRSIRRSAARRARRSAEVDAG